MNGRHLKIDKDDWQTRMRANVLDAVRFGHLPGRPCRECKHRYRQTILDPAFVPPVLVCSRCDISWPLVGKKWRFGLK